MIKPHECTQCGSTDFEETGNSRMRCSFCGSLFEILRNEPQLRINKGAHVTFGERANVEIRGDMEIEAWADVDIRGKVTLVKGKEGGNSPSSWSRGKSTPIEPGSIHRQFFIYVSRPGIDPALQIPHFPESSTDQQLQRPAGA